MGIAWLQWWLLPVALAVVLFAVWLARKLAEPEEDETHEPRDPRAQRDSGLLRVNPLRRYKSSMWTWPRFWRALLCGERPVPIPSWTGLVEPAERRKIGIACSGGGIRSAAFNLGALQVLQEREVLRQARYLAGVSGGSYIAASFCMVRKTWTGEEKPDKPEPGWDDSDPALVPLHPPYFPGSPEEQYLRNRSSYLAPGAFGKIKFGYRLLLGMALNLLFIALVIVTVALPLALLYAAIFPKIDAHIVHGGECLRLVAHPRPEQLKTLCNLLPTHVSTGLWVPIVAVAGGGLVLGAASIVAYRWKPFVTEVTEVWSLRLFLLASGAGMVLIGLPLLLGLYRALGTVIPSKGNIAHHAKGLETVVSKEGVRFPISTTAVGAAGGGGLIVLGSAMLLQLRAEVADAKRLVKDAQAVRGWIAKLSPALRRGLALAIVSLLGPLLALTLTLETMSVMLNLQHPWVRWAVVGVDLAVFTVVYLFADMTTWSLHSFYRHRLSEAFALKRVARNKSDPHQTQASEDPPIGTLDTGKAEARNYRRLVPLSDTAIPVDAHGRQQWPTLLVCAAANISDNAATPPGRAVTSFTFSPTAMGGPLVGAIETRMLESVCDRARRRYFSLPAAVAMSGAALSPSMGKMTRAPLRFLMALANVRLGVWVPNPRRLASFESKNPEFASGGFGKRVQKVRNRYYPTPRPLYLLRELLGINPLNAKFLYVTDGGHYENLGIVELLRRGCTEIYCFDASNDNFDAIGDAVSLARSELDVRVDIQCDELKPDKDSGIAQTDCVTGTITYPGEDEPAARLFYARLVMTRDVPADVMAYRNHDAHFPHDPTTDQLYTDQRFEAYRALGAKAARTALKRREEVPGYELPPWP